MTDSHSSTSFVARLRPLMLGRFALPRFGGNFQLLSDARGTVLVMAAFALPVLIGICGLALEGASWYQTTRAMQNAADTAAIAAATNGSAGAAAEARAVAGQYGFAHDGDATIVDVDDTAACPTGGPSKCYRVAITRKVPLLLAQVIGYSGTSLVSGKPAVALSSAAVAKPGSAPRKYCVMALATIGTALESNGAPKADLSGCNIVSNSDMNCNGHNLKADNADAVGYVDDCGISRTPNIEPVEDPYKSLADNIPASTCTKPSATSVTGNQAWTGTKTFCGDLNLTGDVTLTGDNVTIVIQNGSLNLGDSMLKTATGKTATIIFTGSDSYQHKINATKKGAILDIKAPDSGVWKGIAVYYDPAMTKNIDLDYDGNRPSYAITGVIYMPNSNVSFGGAVGKATSSTEKCMVLVVNTLEIHGTGAMLSGDCEALGYTMPTGNMPARASLVS